GKRPPECVSDDRDLCVLAASENRDDVESTGRLADAFSLEIGLGGPKNPSLFLDRHRFRRRAECGALPPLDFHEAERARFARNEVHLTDGSDEVALQDFVARRPEPLGRDPLPLLSAAAKTLVSALPLEEFGEAIEENSGKHLESLCQI